MALTTTAARSARSGDGSGADVRFSAWMRGSRLGRQQHLRAHPTAFARATTRCGRTTRGWSPARPGPPRAGRAWPAAARSRRGAGRAARRDRRSSRRPPAATSSSQPSSSDSDDGHRPFDRRGRARSGGPGRWPGSASSAARSRMRPSSRGRRVPVVAEDHDAEPRRDLPAHVRPEPGVPAGVADDPAGGEVLDDVEPVAVRHRLEVDDVGRRGREPWRDRPVGLLHLAA